MLEDELITKKLTAELLAREHAKAKRERWELELAHQLLAAGAPPFVREHRFAHPRRWRFDFAWPRRKLAVEVEGLTVAGGRHQRISGYRKDLEKYNAATLAGWRVLRVSTRDVKAGTALALVLEALA